MKKNDRMSLILGEALALKGTVDAYTEAQKRSGCCHPMVGYDNLTMRCSRQAIKRRIVQMRQDLLALEDEMNGMDKEKSDDD